MASRRPSAGSAELRESVALSSLENRDEQVTRNLDRFPGDFMFRLNAEEWAALKSQTATSNTGEGRGGRRRLPRVFTEQGVAMLSSVLRRRRAVHVNIAIMRTFVHLRRLGRGQGGLLERLDEPERRVGGHDSQFRAVFRAVRKLVEGPSRPGTTRIGFTED